MTAPVRRMTEGEVAMASLLFRDAIDYARVRIFGRGFLPFGLQHPHVAIAPNGNIYFSGVRYQEDFSRSTLADRRWFIHEMTHVWQHQLGYPVMLRGALRLFLPYVYVLAPHKRLADYNMEAQGELLADYFALRFLDAPGVLSAGARHAAQRADYEQVLASFLADPTSKAHLPRSRLLRRRQA